MRGCGRGARRAIAAEAFLVDRTRPRRADHVPDGISHVLTADYYPLPAVVEKAFAQSTVLIEEVDMDELANPATLMSLLGKAVYTDGRTLDKVISPELYKAVVVRAEKAGLPAVAIQRMKPWMAAVSLTAPAIKAAGFDANQGVDKYSSTGPRPRASNAGARDGGVSIRSSRSDADPAAGGDAAVGVCRHRQSARNVKAIADAWARGDTSDIERDLHGAFKQSPELYDRLLAERNRNWVAPVEVPEAADRLLCRGRRCPPGGAGKPRELLQKKGYTVEQQ